MDLIFRPTRSCDTVVQNHWPHDAFYDLSPGEFPELVHSKKMTTNTTLRATSVQILTLLGRFYMFLYKIVQNTKLYALARRWTIKNSLLMSCDKIWYGKSIFEPLNHMIWLCTTMMWPYHSVMDLCLVRCDSCENSPIMSFYHPIISLCHVIL